MIAMNIDRKYIRETFALAKKGMGRTSPNPMVGAVLVRDGAVMGKGYHEVCGGPHAEINALREAGEKAKGATCYVNLEPCCSHGRTPPCADALIKAGVARVVASVRDPDPRTDGRSLEKFKENGVEVTCGVLEKQARRLNEVFFHYVQTKLPFVILKAAISWDGKLATHTGRSKWITNEKSRLEAHVMRQACDAVLVGVHTIYADDPALNVRHPDYENPQHPVKIVLDPNLRTPPVARIFSHTDSGASVIIVHGVDAPQEKMRRLSEAGATLLTIPYGDRTMFDLKALKRKIGERGVTSVLVEGGGRVATSFLEAGIVDKVALFAAPILIGGRNSVQLFCGKDRNSIDDAIRLKDVSYRRFGTDMMMTGYPV